MSRDRTALIPAGWRMVELGDVAEQCLGKMLDGEKNRGLPLPYLRNPNVRWFEVDTTNLQEMPFESHELERYGLRKGDVLVCEGGEAGRAAIWDGRLTGMKFQKAIHRVRPGADLYNRFLVHQLMADYHGGRLADYYTGTTIKHLTGQDLAKYRFALPPMPEQRRIVEVLDRAEALRAKHRAALAQLDTLAQSIFSDLFGDPFSGRSGVVPLGEIADIDMGQSPPGSSYNTTGIGTPLLNGPTEFGRRYPIQVQWTTSPTRLCRAGDILFCVRGATAGRLNRADKTYCLGRGLAAIRPRLGAGANADFLFAVLDRYYSYFQETGVGSTFINISRDDLQNLPFPGPHKDLAAAFASRVAGVEGLRATHRASLAELDSLFSSLQHRAFRGEL